MAVVVTIRRCADKLSRTWDAFLMRHCATSMLASTSWAADMQTLGERVTSLPPRRRGGSAHFLAQADCMLPVVARDWYDQQAAELSVYAKAHAEEMAALAKSAARFLQTAQAAGPSGLVRAFKAAEGCDAVRSLVFEYRWGLLFWRGGCKQRGFTGNGLGDYQLICGHSHAAHTQVKPAESRFHARYYSILGTLLQARSSGTLKLIRVLL